MVTRNVHATRPPVVDASVALAFEQAGRVYSGKRRGPEIQRTSEFRVLRRILGPKLCPHKLVHGHTYASPTVLVCFAKSYLLPSMRNQGARYVGYRETVHISRNLVWTRSRETREEVYTTYASSSPREFARYASNIIRLMCVMNTLSTQACTQELPV